MSGRKGCTKPVCVDTIGSEIVVLPDLKACLLLGQCVLFPLMNVGHTIISLGTPSTWPAFASLLLCTPLIFPVLFWI